MEHLLDQPSDVCDLMPCKFVWCKLKHHGWAFWRRKHNDELDYQQSINSSSVGSIFPTEKWRIQSVMEEMMETEDTCLVQFWAPIKVNGSTFLSTADQTFAFYKGIDKRHSSYRKLCLDTLIPIDNEIPFGPLGRVFSRRLPEYNPDVRSYSSAEFPLLQTAIPLGIHSYYAFPFSNRHNQLCVGVFEIVSTQLYLHFPASMGLNFESVRFYIPYSINKLFEPPKPLFCDIKDGLYRILQDRWIPFAQIWIPFSRSASSKILYCAAASTNEYFSLIYHEFEYASKVCFIKSGEALVGRAFASQGSCFCKDVTLLSIEEYPLVPGARKAKVFNKVSR